MAISLVRIMSAWSITVLKDRKKGGTSPGSARTNFLRDNRLGHDYPHPKLLFWVGNFHFANEFAMKSGEPNGKLLSNMQIHR